MLYTGNRIGGSNPPLSASAARAARAGFVKVALQHAARRSLRQLFMPDSVKDRGRTASPSLVRCRG